MFKKTSKSSFNQFSFSVLFCIFCKKIYSQEGPRQKASNENGGVRGARDFVQAMDFVQGDSKRGQETKVCMGQGEVLNFDPFFESFKKHTFYAFGFLSISFLFLSVDSFFCFLFSFQIFSFKKIYF
jgi:hypothetical protein